ncbi:MAG: DUF6134 family protein [Magnetospirillum sp.]|nr:DUF6134 family protein [Magnetospirillum sp.]
MRLPLSIATLTLVLPLVAAAEPVALAYDIRKEGEPIGRETVRIIDQGGTTAVQVETRTRAKVLFLEFHYDHSRHEEWRDGKLLRMAARTDDDGSKTQPEASAGEAGWTLTVNGQATQRAGDSLPLTLWGRAILGKAELFSVIDAKPYRVQVASLGAESVDVGGKAVKAEHVRISGDVERDLWYGADGYLLRATFQRAGYPIEMVRLDR